jgi:hypothetical protein
MSFPRFGGSGTPAFVPLPFSRRFARRAWQFVDILPASVASASIAPFDFPAALIKTQQTLPMDVANPQSLNKLQK